MKVLTLKSIKNTRKYKKRQQNFAIVAFVNCCLWSISIVAFGQCCLLSISIVAFGQYQLLPLVNVAFGQYQLLPLVNINGPVAESVLFINSFDCWTIYGSWLLLSEPIDLTFYR
jgi:hypothetical protein